jgi:hypothetical protein
MNVEAISQPLKTRIASYPCEAYRYAFRLHECPEGQKAKNDPLT